MELLEARSLEEIGLVTWREQPTQDGGFVPVPNGRKMVYEWWVTKPNWDDPPSGKLP